MMKPRKQWTLQASLTGLLIVAVCALVTYNMRDILFGSPFSVRTAPDGTTVSDAFVPITGDARHAKELTINGRPIAIDTNGAFSDGVLLSPGYNIVSVALSDRFGKEQIKTYHWFVEPKASVAAAGVGAKPAAYIEQDYTPAVGL